MPSTLLIRNVHLAYDDAQNARKVFDVFLQDGKVSRISDASERESHVQEDDGPGEIIDVEAKGLLLPLVSPRRSSRLRAREARLLQSESAGQ